MLSLWYKQSVCMPYRLLSDAVMKLYFLENASASLNSYKTAIYAFFSIEEF